VSLGVAYRGGDLSTVYPVPGIGSAPGALLGLGVLGERLSAPQLTGVVFLLAGTLAAAIPGPPGIPCDLPWRSAA